MSKVIVKQKHHMSKDKLSVNIVGYVVIGLFALICLLPFYLIIVASFTDEASLIRNGYPLIPTDFSVQSYLLCLNGGKTDILGFSYYPYWYDMIAQHKEKKPVDLFYNPLIYYAERYKKPVMIVEVGGPETDEEGTYTLLMNTMEAVRQVPNNQGLGVFYWEPEVGADLLPDKYPLGAALALDEHTIQFTKALTAYKAFQEQHS